MAANEMFQQLVQKLYSSQLHFHITETPFSAQILIRKRFLKDRSIQQSSTSSNFSNEKISNLENQILELQTKVKDSSAINDILEKKLGEAEAKAVKIYEEKKIEAETLKSSVKKGDFLTSNLKKNLEAEQKVVKENEKVIQKLELKNENLTITNKNMKIELNKVKNENKKLLKNKNQRSQSQNRFVQTLKSDTSKIQMSDYEEDSNQNMTPSRSSKMCPTSSSPSRAPAFSSVVADPCLKSPATPPRASHGTTTPCSPTNASSGSKATVVHEGICQHSPQCTVRQPKPPPLDKCTVLVHHGSEYHEHMKSQGGVPHQLGETHEYCMRIDYENYGCEDCKWFKRWGELHGYPDINPWIFKEHRQPLTYL